jgi:hypothetical protein
LELGRKVRGYAYRQRMLNQCLRRQTANHLDSLGKAYKTQYVGRRWFPTSLYRPSISHEGEQGYSEKVRLLMRRVTQPGNYPIGPL